LSAYPALATLQTAVRSAPQAWHQAWPSRSLAGFACTYAPLELLHAAGLSPLRLPANRRSARADSWLPPFVCPIVRGMLATALEGELHPLAAIVLPHTCDSLQELGGIWQSLRPQAPLLIPVGPLASPNPRAATYLQQTLRALARRIDRPVSDAALAASLALYNRLRRARREIDALRDRLTAAEAWAALAAAWQMPPEDYVESAEVLVHQLKAAALRGTSGPRLLLAGSVLDEPLIPALIDALGGSVVGDDLCNGMRDAEPQAMEEGDPWAALAQRLLARPACPCQQGPTTERVVRLRALARQRGAQGVILALAKFCDPHAFDAVPLGQALEQAGIHFLVLEVEAVNAPEQLRTRLQAFLELLTAG